MRHSLSPLLLLILITKGLGGWFGVGWLIWGWVVGLGSVSGGWVVGLGSVSGGWGLGSWLGLVGGLGMGWMGGWGWGGGGGGVAV